MLTTGAVSEAGYDKACENAWGKFDFWSKPTGSTSPYTKTDLWCEFEAWERVSDMEGDLLTWDPHQKLGSPGQGWTLRLQTILTSPSQSRQDPNDISTLKYQRQLCNMERLTQTVWRRGEGKSRVCVGPWEMWELGRLDAPVMEVHWLYRIDILFC